jgi:hypothetical protein
VIGLYYKLKIFCKKDVTFAWFIVIIDQYIVTRLHNSVIRKNYIYRI